VRLQLHSRAIKGKTAMKLVRFGAPGREKPGIVDRQGRIHDLSKIVPDIAGETLSPKWLAKIRKANVDKLPLAPKSVRLGPCVGNTRHFIAIGLNYIDHAIETNAEIPKEPIIFAKAPTCINGPYDDIVLPKGSRKSDWEVELCVVIGSRAHYLPKNKVMSAVAGYTICNDVSEREYQLERETQWHKGKGCPTFGPIGPWLVTKDEIRDVQNLDMFLEVNGKRLQNSSTKNMIFKVAHIVWYCSQFFVLEPGDLITTGTPPGVGLGMKLERFLKSGDEIRLGISGLGEQRQKVRRYTT
jgi:2-keto-4-pentenoate hydratase/2-oxohepta-3-ene-1,7-dioic acid hydratase in catechol pathway